MDDGLTLEQRMRITRYSVPSAISAKVAIEAGFDGNSMSYYAQVFYLGQDRSDYFGPPDFANMGSLAGLLYRIGDFIDTEHPDFFPLMHTLMCDPIAVELGILYRKSPRMVARSVDLVQSVIDRQIVGYGHSSAAAQTNDLNG